jgi:hypothetical protein
MGCLLSALAAFGRGRFAGVGAVAGGAAFAMGGEGCSADGADVGPIVVGVADLGCFQLALLAAVAGGVMGLEGPAAVEAVQAENMAIS